MVRRVENAEALARVLAGLKSQGKIIVLALGSFENLRPADVRYLEDAKTRGDYLIAGVGPKWSASKSKRMPGLRVPARDRAEVLASLRWVDYATIFEEESADKLIRLLHPSILAYSVQYSERTAPEKATAQELEIPIMICGESRPSAPSGSRRLLASRKGR